MSAACDQLSPFLDGELSGPEADAFRDHLATCDECARELHGDMMLEALEGVHAGGSTAAGEGSGKVRPIHSAPRWLWRAVIPVTLAAAAGVALWMTRAPLDRGAVAIVGAPLPDYELAVTGGDRATRSEATPVTGPLDLRRDSRIELVLRPSKPVTGPVAARGFLVQGTDARGWNPSMDVSSDGAVRIAGRVGDLLGVPAGAWDLVLAVGRPDALPSDPQAVVRAMTGGASRRSCQILVKRIHLVDGP